ncbi:hypothetical protein [Metasolibacillus sp.]|uniref:DUF7168 domain-containing protein n=1 Tax=Metasolibacillus sp. TaxID=2703680 RepID=UPI0025D2E4F3|nr:hypothetical protein [Metasolibacillus sp.]MCT6922788.1 hypothetical protein [Metasolibacillus sp.]MCT6938873.1 hypothetical protein [Metasolibacillus sp.]
MYILANEALLFYANRYVDHYYSITSESRNRANTLRIKNAYMLGFIEGLEMKLEEQRNQLQQEYGLVVLMPVVVEERYKKIESGFTGNANPFQLPNIDSINESLAYKRGLEDGETIDYTQSTIHDEIVI